MNSETIPNHEMQGHNARGITFVDAIQTIVLAHSWGNTP